MSGRVPVLIAARDEAEHIDQTLGSLPPEAEPIVIVNGCRDATAQIAEQHGAVVLYSDIEGKLPAIQMGLRYLGTRALEPLVTLDADSQPLMPQRWLGALLRTRASLDPERPACVVGNSIYEHQSAVRGLAATAKHWYMVMRTARDPHAGYFHGRDMALHLLSEQALADILALPNIWPGEDEAIKDVVLAHGGQVIKSRDLRSAVRTPADRALPVFTRLRLGSRASRIISRASYLRDAPAGSTPYN